MWHYECNGQPVGPVSEEALKLLIRDGVLERTTLVWKSGMSAWANADETELMPYFDTPPPLAPKRTIPRSLNENTPESKVSRTGPNTSQDELSSRYAEASSEPSEQAGFSKPTSQLLRRPYEVFTGAAEPLLGIFKHAQAAVSVFVAVSAIAIVSDFASISFIDQAFSGTFESQAELDSQAATVDAFTQYAAVAYLIVFAWTAIVVGRWTYRAMKNLRGMGYETTVSPAWAVGWHFIPIALLWMPFRGMAQIWRGSIHGAPIGEAKLPASMRLWWACWLFGNWFSFGAFRAQETGLATENFELVQAAMGIGILGSGLHIVSAFLLLGLMQKISRAHGDQTAMQFN